MWYFLLLKDITLVSGFKTVKPPNIGRGPTAGDSNCDGIVDIVDVVNLRAAFGLSDGQTGYDQDLDFNGDTLVDITDFVILKIFYGSNAISPPTGLCINH